MKERYRAAPIALARYAPVAQAVIDLALRGRSIAADFPFQALGDLLLRGRRRQAVEKARIDDPPVAFIGNVCDDEGLGILSFRANHRGIAEAVFVGKLKVALVMGRGTVNGA